LPIGRDIGVAVVVHEMDAPAIRLAFAVSASTGRPRARLSRNMPASHRVADCDHCAALCCIWLGFDASPAFAFSKPAGEPCSNLRGERCAIHARKVELGFAGCAAFDCLGAGQRATAALARGAYTARERYETFTILRELHDLLALLDGARDLRGDRIAIDAAIDALEAVAELPVPALLTVDLAPHRATVRALFRIGVR
jgi:hypothetical protein